MTDDPRRLPIGAVTQRANGAVWRKDGHGKDMTQIKPPDRQPGGKKGLPPALPSHNPPSTSQGWQAFRKSLKLDGHLPDDTIHPAMVQIDLEGDTDSKPVLSWTDHTGRRRNTYTERFHHHRSQHLKAEVSKHHHALEGAHAALSLKLAELSGKPKGDAVAAALTHLTTGHRVSDLLRLTGAHATINGGADITPKTPPTRESLLADAGDEPAIEKSYTSAVPHPDRVHLMMTHPSGSLYPTHFVDKHIADHLMVSHRDDISGPLFRTSEDDVRKELEEVGVHDIDPAVVRHHAVSRMASDMLSKMPEVDLGIDGNLDVAKAHVAKVSDEIGKRFGHPPAPEGMSHVPPHVIAAYFHHSNGHALWPKAFPPCTSPSEAAASSTPPTPTSTSGSPATTDTSSTPPTSLVKQKTPTPSPKDSSRLRLIKGRPWDEVADEVEGALGRPFAVRLAPVADDVPPRYLAAPTYVAIDEVVKGVKVIDRGQEVVVDDVVGETAIVKSCGREFEVGVGDVADLAAGDSVHFWMKARPYDRSMARLATMTPQQLIDEKLVPKKKVTAKERGQRGYLRRAAKLAKLARNGDQAALVELRHVVGALQAHPLEGSFSTDTIAKSIRDGGETYFYADGTVVLMKGARGPAGDPIGTVRQHADGSRWEKREDGWHELAEGTSKEGEKSANGELRPVMSVGAQHATRVLESLRERIAATADEKERLRLKQQIALIRQRLAAYTRDAYAGVSAPHNKPDLHDNQNIQEFVAKDAFIDRMHAHLKHVISKAMVSSPQDAIAQVVIGDDLAAHAELASLRNFGADPIETARRWMRGDRR